MERPPPLSERWSRRFLVTMTTGLLIVAALRWFHADLWFRRPAVIGIVSGGPFLLAAVYPTLGFALIRRAWGFVTVLSLLIVAHLWWTVPDIGLPDLGSSDTGSTDTGLTNAESAAMLTVATSNLLFDNPDPTAILAELADADAQVIVLNELTPELNDILLAAGSYDRWPHRQLDPHRGAHGTGLLSTIPFIEHGTRDFDGVPASRALIDSAAGPVEILAVHASAPLSSRGIDRWHRQMNEYVEAAETLAHPFVFIGDFNATRQHHALQQLLNEVRDVHLEVGTGLGATWPANSLLPELLRIDRILVSETITPVSIRRGVGEGSDHRPIIGTIALPTTTR